MEFKMIKLYHLDSAAMMKGLSFTRADAATVKQNLIDDHYTHVADVDVNDLDQMYELTNHIDHDWTTNKEVTLVVPNSQHRSTSVGDLAKIDGKFFVCASIGWDEVSFK
jgi:hypothetical protein